MRRIKKHRHHIATGLIGLILFAKILTINIGENILHQFLGAEFGVTVETIFLSVAFTLLLWFIIQKT